MTGNLCPLAANRVRGSIPSIQRQETNPAPPANSPPQKTKKSLSTQRPPNRTNPERNKAEKGFLKNRFVYGTPCGLPPRKTEYPQKRKSPKPQRFQGLSVLFSRRSGETRTRGLDIPNVAPYQLGYTPIGSLSSLPPEQPLLYPKPASLSSRDADFFSLFEFRKCA